MAVLSSRSRWAPAAAAAGAGGPPVLTAVVVAAVGVGSGYLLVQQGAAAGLGVLGAVLAVWYVLAAAQHPELGVWLVGVVGPFVGALMILTRGGGLSLLSDLLVILPLLALMLRWFVHPAKVTVWSGLPALVWIFVGVALVQLVTSESHLMLPGIYGFRQSVLPVLLFIVAYNMDLSSRDRLDRMVTVFVAVGAVTSLWGLHQRFVGLTAAEAEYAAGIHTFWVAGELRIFSSLGSPWGFAAYQAMIGILAAAMAVRLRGTGRRLMLICWGLATLTLVFTQMRGPLLGYMLGLLFLALVVVGSRFERRWIVLAFCGGVAGYILLVVAVGPELARRVSPASVVGQRLVSILTPLQEDAMRARFVTWESIWPIILSHPLGLGLGTTEGASIRFDELLRYGSISSDNLYLAVLLEMGWPGVALLVVIVLSVMTKGMRQLGTGTHPREEAVRAGFTACLVMVTVGNLATPLGFCPVAAHLYWVAAGITANRSWARPTRRLG